MDNRLTHQLQLDIDTPMKDKPTTSPKLKLILWSEVITSYFH